MDTCGIWTLCELLETNVDCLAMARRGAARRMKRIAKRDVAKEERGGQKYKNQKGGISKRDKVASKRDKVTRRQESDGAEDEDEDEVCARV